MNLLPLRNVYNSETGFHIRARKRGKRGDEMEEFETLLEAERSCAERYVRFRLSSRADADDVLQEVFLAAYQKFPQLKDKGAFKAWLISIARNKCSDYFRKKAAQLEIPIDSLTERELSEGRRGVAEAYKVRETLELLGGRDKQILYLYFWKELPQAEIARRLDIPVGTVKSRLHTAKRRFKDRYPYHTDARKGEQTMKKLPEFLPAYKIEPSSEAPFPVKWEELMGWFIVPKLGEKLSWAMYDFPEKKRTEMCVMEVVGKAMIHGIEGVEISSVEYDPMDCNKTGTPGRADRTFVAQLTDTHCRILAETHTENGVKKLFTFLDGEGFLGNWGFGEDNCGNETDLKPKGDITRSGSVITAADKEFLLDVVGRYTVTIGGKSYDTVCVMDIETYNGGTVSGQFIDRNGRTVLWRRFNRDDWAIDRYKKRWSELLPENERFTVNGETYVHWYDCVTDYIFD